MALGLTSTKHLPWYQFHPAIHLRKPSACSRWVVITGQPAQGGLNHRSLSFVGIIFATNHTNYFDLRWPQVLAKFSLIFLPPWTLARLNHSVGPKSSGLHYRGPVIAFGTSVSCNLATEGESWQLWSIQSSIFRCFRFCTYLHFYCSG